MSPAISASGVMSPAVSVGPSMGDAVDPLVADRVHNMETQMLRYRQGAVLARGTMLKRDHFARGIHMKVLSPK
jgi:hypothetical protein